jgi:preprotein translocase subunit SecD
LSLPPPFRPAAIPFQPHLLSSRSVVEVRSEQELREALNKARQSGTSIEAAEGGATATFTSVTILLCAPIRLSRTVNIGSDLNGLEIRAAGFQPLTGNISTLFRLDQCLYVRLTGLAMPFRITDATNRVCVALNGCGFCTVSGCWMASDADAVKTLAGDSASVGFRLVENSMADASLSVYDSSITSNYMGDLALQSGSNDVMVTSNFMKDVTLDSGSSDVCVVGNRVDDVTNNGGDALLIGNHVTGFEAGTWTKTGNI